ncbi:MAG: dephospho-CoA kinase, partial [Gammaproteobacteria bacterium]|nr:dephospho-CoA kinase [Gammaproteobacteria bacterium]
MRPVLVIGVTGGIGSGKTTVANLFSSLGVPVIDADELARQVVAPGQPAYEEILQHFGTTILGKSGELDRRRLRERIFSDSAKRDRLEAIVHPRVYAQMKHLLDCLETPYAIVVVPLLIESGARELVDRVLVVDSPEELQIERTHRRDGTTRAAVKKILAAQLDRSARLSAADDIIENDASLEALAKVVSRLHR